MYVNFPHLALVHPLTYPTLFQNVTGPPEHHGIWRNLPTDFSPSNPEVPKGLKNTVGEGPCPEMGREKKIEMQAELLNDDNIR